MEKSYVRLVGSIEKRLRIFLGVRFEGEMNNFRIKVLYDCARSKKLVPGRKNCKSTRPFLRGRRLVRGFRCIRSKKEDRGMKNNGGRESDMNEERRTRKRFQRVGSSRYEQSKSEVIARTREALVGTMEALALKLESKRVLRDEEKIKTKVLFS